MSLSPDGSRLAIARTEGPRGGTGRRDDIRIIDTASWNVVRTIPEAFGPVAFSPDGARLVTQTTNGLAVWNLGSDGAPVILQDSTNLFGPARSDHALAFSPDGKSIVAARNALSERGVFVLSIWDTASGKELAVMPNDPDHVEHTGAISALAFSPDGHTLATASHDHSIRLWDFAKRQPIDALQGHLNEVWCFAYSPDGRSIISGAKDGGLNLWNALAQNSEDLIPGSWSPIAFSKDSRTLAAVSRERAAVFFNVTTREPEQQIPLEAARFGFPNNVALSADVKVMVQPQNDGTIKVWNTETRDTFSIKASDRRIDWLTLSADGASMVTWGHLHTTRLWDLARGTNTVLGQEAQRALFAPDGRTLAVFHHRDALQIWDLPGPTLRTNLQSEGLGGFGAAISPDSRFLATSDRSDVENSIRLLDLKTAGIVATLVGHKQGVNSIAFSPDGKTLATASDDSTLKFWNIASQQELLTIRRLGGTLRGLQFSPDGQMLVGASGFFSQSSSGELRFYRAPLLSQIDSAR